MSNYRKKKNKKTRYKWKDYTLDEQFTIISIVICILFLAQHYILAYIGKDPMQELAVTLVTAVVVILVKYAIKSFKAKREEENMRFKRDKEGLSDWEDESEEMEFID